MSRRSRLIVALMIAWTGEARAQSLSSPFGTVSQKIDSTTITIEYYRPSARGRNIFGSLVRYGELWTPGANWATTVEVTRDVRIQGQPLPAGKYSLWFIPAAPPDSWTVVLSKTARRFHVVKPLAADDQLRFRMTPDSAPVVEALTFWFPTVTRGGTMLTFQWAATTLPMWIDIVSSRTDVTASRPLPAYAGEYNFNFADVSSGTPIPWEVIARGNTLWVRTTQEAVEPGYDTEFELMPVGGDQFHPRQFRNGKLVGDEMDEIVVFQFDGSEASGFEIRGVAEAKVLGRARRKRG